VDEVSSLPDLDDSALTTIYGHYAQQGNQEKAMAIYQQGPEKVPKVIFPGSSADAISNYSGSKIKT